jgi:hypothetical protein
MTCRSQCVVKLHDRRTSEPNSPRRRVGRLGLI